MSKGKYGWYRTKRDKEEELQKRELTRVGSLMDHFGLESIAQSTEQDRNDKTTWVQDDKRKWYILDTNLILSCVDVIYDETDPNWRPPLDFRPNLDNAHLIIPEVVFEELNRIKDGFTINRSIARKAFQRLERFFPNSERTLWDIMMLRQPVRTGWKNQLISILPLSHEFSKSLPWAPEAKDNDGWIAVTALAATMIRDGLMVDGSVTTNDILQRSNKRTDVVLLTNDRPLLTKADMYAVRARPYSFKERPPFTGIRELTVPAEMFEIYYHEEQLSREDFEKYLPSEPSLVDNEYIIMTPEGDKYPKGYFAVNEPYINVARYHKERGMFYPLRFMKHEGVVPPNARIAAYYDAMNDDNISTLVVTGKAGTGKTFQIIVHAIRALKRGDFAQIVLIIDSDNGIGYLPGGVKQKVAPMVEFCKDAIRSYLAQTPEFKKKRELLRKFGDCDEVESDDDYDYRDSRGKDRPSKKAHKGSKKTYYELINEETDYLFDRYFEVIPYKQTQGRSFEDAIVIIDEAQRIIIDSMETFITRPAQHSLLVVCGDVNQIKFNSPEKRVKNGLIFTRKLYFDWKGCANIHLVDNMRHEAADIANQNYEKVIEELSELQT